MAEYTARYGGSPAIEFHPVQSSVRRLPQREPHALAKIGLERFKPDIENRSGKDRSLQVSGFKGLLDSGEWVSANVDKILVVFVKAASSEIR